MANLKEIKSRIVSIGSTMQITSAMKMVSAAKLKRAQNAITQMRPYANKLTELLANLSSSLESSEQGGFSIKRKLKKVLIIPITSNRGLCGGFNANVIKASKSLCENDYKDYDSSILSIGKKSSDFFRKNNFNVISSHDEVFSNLNYESISKIALNVMNMFVDEKFDKVVIVYNQFKNAATQNVMTENFLPVENNENSEASLETIFLSLKKKILFLNLSQSLLKLSFSKPF